MDAAERTESIRKSVDKRDKNIRLALGALAEGKGSEALFAAALLRIWVKVEQLLEK